MDFAGGSYDFESIMHYGNYAFSKNEKPTMLSVKDPLLQFGQIAKMSKTDILQLNTVYDCRCEYVDVIQNWREVRTGKIRVLVYRYCFVFVFFSGKFMDQAAGEVHKLA